MAQTVARPTSNVRRDRRGGSAARAWLTPRETALAERAFQLGKLAVVERAQLAASVYRVNGMSAPAGALEQLVDAQAELQFDVSYLATDR